MYDSSSRAFQVYYTKIIIIKSSSFNIINILQPLARFIDNIIQIKQTEELMSHNSSVVEVLTVL